MNFGQIFNQISLFEPNVQVPSGISRTLWLLSGRRSILHRVFRDSLGSRLRCRGGKQRRSNFRSSIDFGDRCGSTVRNGAARYAPNHRKYP
jgi:hypothetical protein